MKEKSALCCLETGFPGSSESKQFQVRTFRGKRREHENAKPTGRCPSLYSKFTSTITMTTNTCSVPFCLGNLVKKKEECSGNEDHENAELPPGRSSKF